MDLTTEAQAQSNRPIEYCMESQKEAKAIGRMFGSMLHSKVDQYLLRFVHATRENVAY